ncbi:MAG TPA: AtpZ/AtpI family protein [Thermodesulfobacteriota bacterium]|nr:AtpZ/AtpI family protein [Deltaproteobacteria bacterium]HNR12278.1 AtpZ/AtpI family protein [Thermodesulfobacteriota bacterium]HNU70775.1 AtpZ/AtpI family protein [Thermodesulfobacteriota bacterium]HOC38390.1 AtpZ/AtpI family protein [Thermodesulfobacteriota bacterium]
MGNRIHRDSPEEIHRAFLKKIVRKEERKVKGRKEKNHQSVWFGLGTIGVVGWSVTIPTLLGIAVGIWIDRTWPSRHSWTLMLLIIGVIIGCLNAWFWVQRESSTRR